MYRITTILFPIAFFAGCDPGGESRALGDFQAVDNRSEAQLRFADAEDPSAPASADAVDIECASGVATDLTTRIDKGTLIIDGQSSAACTVVLRTDRVEHVTVHGDGDVDATGDWEGLASLDLRGASEVRLHHVLSDDFALSSRGAAHLWIDDLEVGYAELDLAGSSETQIAGAVDAGMVTITGDAALYARDCAFEELTIDASGNAVVEVTANVSVTGSVDGAAELDLWGDANIGAGLIGDLGLDVHGR